MDGITEVIYLRLLMFLSFRINRPTIWNDLIIIYIILMYLYFENKQYLVSWFWSFQQIVKLALTGFNPTCLNPTV